MTQHTGHEILEARAHHQGAIEALEAAIRITRSSLGTAGECNIAIFENEVLNHQQALQDLARYHVCDRCGGNGWGDCGCVDGCSQCGGSGYTMEET
jgi:DnaJ-class molecular chaperone